MGGVRRPSARRRRWPWVVLGVVGLVLAGLVVNYWPQTPPDPVPGNGPVASPAQPWVVAIGTPGRSGDAPSAKSCVGTLVAPRAVVTAGHCLYGHPASDFVVIGGRTDLRGTEGRTVAVSDVWVAPGYPAPGGLLDGATGTLDSPPDIGLMLLAADLPYRPLPMADTASAPAAAGTEARITGWRVSPDDRPVLWQSPTTVVDDARCHQVAADARSYFPSVVLHGYRYDPAAYLCAGEGDRAVPARPTDSGAPLVIDGQLAGVNAWNPQVDARSAQFYARVATYSGRIAELVEAGTGTGRFPR